MTIHDLVIRNATIVDGSGAAAFRGDVAVDGAVIAAVGAIAARGRKEIDAGGLILTPGFVDIHTHYDGQMIWAERMSPSSDHGVTTVMTGNCGIGFAPCRAADRVALMELMEGVEDIPGAVTSVGLDWRWQSFPDFLDAVECRRRDIDVAAMVPHSPLRVFVMGERGIAREPATAADMARMNVLMAEALAAGAIGFGTSSFPSHRSAKGEQIPSFAAAEAELGVIADALREAGHGIFQMVPSLKSDRLAEELAMMRRLSQRAERPVTYTHAAGAGDPDAWKRALTLLAAANDNASVKAQLLPRPIGLVIGLRATVNPFCMAASWQSIAGLPLAEKVAAMRDPAMRRRLIDEVPQNPSNPLFLMGRNFHLMFPITTATPDYEPPRDSSVQALADQAGIDSRELVYDMLLEEDGNRLLLVALFNYEHYSLDFMHSMLRDENVLVGLGDGGAHYGMICDASYTTFMLTHWARDRAGARLTLEEVVHHLTRRPAALIGLTDRGLVAQGHRASLNLIDLNRLKLLSPEIVHDLPGGGKRLHQRAEGYVATIVNGQIIAENGKPTGALPGILIRAGRGRNQLAATARE